MTKQIYPTDLTDNQWHLIKELIPLAKPGRRPRSLGMRLVISAIFYVVVGALSGACCRVNILVGRSSIITFEGGD
jgi:transposase